MLSEYMEALQRRAIVVRLTGLDLDPPINIENLVHDKRRRTKAARELLAKGFIEPCDENYRLTTHPYDIIAMVEPSLIELVLPPREHPYTDYDLERRPGLVWTTLSLGTQKWVLEHPDDYRLFPFDAGWPHQEPRVYFRVGEVENSHYSLYVTNDALDEELVKRRYVLKFETTRGRNLAWGLEEQDIIEAVDADVFAQSSSTPVPFGHGSAFHHDPAKWEEELRQAVTNNREGIAKLTRETNILCSVRDALAARSGWKGFIKRYEAALHAALKKEEGEEECSD